MVLRLILVGIVAGLGVSPPAESELATWPRSVQTWLDARLAEYCARTLVDENEVVFTVEDEAPASKATEAKVSALDEETDDIADLDMEAVDDESNPESTESPVAARLVLIEDTDLVEGLVFEAVVEEMVADFTRVEAAPRPQTPATTEGAVDTGPGLADAEDPEDGTTEPAPAKVEPMVEVTGDDPLGLDDDLFPGEAFVLNREAQGLDEPAAAVDADTTVVKVPTGNRLGNAVRLTRDAVYAWMNLIQSPAIVTIPR